MAKKKAFALRLDPDVLRMVEKWAEDEFRSTNGQFEWIIAKALRDNGRFREPKSPDDGEQKEKS